MLDHGEDFQPFVEDDVPFENTVRKWCLQHISFVSIKKVAESGWQP
jgi:hypothetical protein